MRGASTIGAPDAAMGLAQSNQVDDRPDRFGDIIEPAPQEVAGEQGDGVEQGFGVEPSRQHRGD